MAKKFTWLIPCIVAAMGFVPGVANADHEINLNLTGAFPQGEFRENVDAGVGLAGGYTYGFRGSSPVSFRIGADTGFYIYGNETREEPFSESIPDVTVEVETSNNIFQLGFAAKLEAIQGSIRPYIEGRAGLSYFYTETSIHDVNGDDDHDIARSKNFDDTTTYTSIGGGVLIPVFSQTAITGQDFTLSVDLKFLYTLGEEADYLKEGSIVRSGGTVTYNPIHSNTDMTSVHLGIAVNF